MKKGLIILTIILTLLIVPVHAQFIDAVTVGESTFYCDCTTSDYVCPEDFTTFTCSDGDIDCSPSNCGGLPPPGSEICTQAGDEDNNGESNYDTSDNLHGDKTCLVYVQSISAPDSVEKDTPFYVDCTVNVQNINSVSAVFEGKICQDINWIGNTARFQCNSGSVGVKTATCTVQDGETIQGIVLSDKSYQGGIDAQKSVEVVSDCIDCPPPITPDQCCDGTQNQVVYKILESGELDYKSSFTCDKDKDGFVDCNAYQWYLDQCKPEITCRTADEDKSSQIVELIQSIIEGII